MLWKSASHLSDIYWRLSTTDPWSLPTLVNASVGSGELVTPISTFHSFLKIHSQRLSYLSASPPSDLSSSFLASWVDWEAQELRSVKQTSAFPWNFFSYTGRVNFRGTQILGLGEDTPSFLTASLYSMAFLLLMMKMPAYFCHQVPVPTFNPVEFGWCDLCNLWGQEETSTCSSHQLALGC